MLAGLTLGALYAGVETGVYTLSPIRLTLRAARGEAAALRLRRHVRRPERTLAVLLIGTNASHYLGSFGLAELLHAVGLTGWALIAFEAAILTPILFVLAEVLPKDLFRTHTDRWTYWAASFISFSRWLFTLLLLLPLVQGLAWLARRLFAGGERTPITARQRMAQLMMEGVGAGVLSPAQAKLTDRALALRDRRVRDVCTPWGDVVTLPIHADRAARDALFKARAFTRVPVVDAAGRVAGVLSWADVALDPAPSTLLLVSEAMTLDADAPVLRAMSLMRRQRQKMAIVTDPASGRPLGLVTLKHLVEPLTGALREW
jgi:CBS domain containing-hemolysin-like protein